MIKFENVEVIGWEAVVRGMHNLKSSLEESDSGICLDTIGCHSCRANRNHCRSRMENKEFVIGIDDMNLMTQLSKFMQMVTVYVDITAPLYWWKELHNYKVGTVDEYRSIMHKLCAKEFTLDDFSCEHLVSGWVGKDKNGIAINIPGPYEKMQSTIELLNSIRETYLYVENTPKEKIDWSCTPSLSEKDILWNIVQLLPSSYNQTRTVMFNYEVLSDIYQSCKNHELDEWRIHNTSKDFNSDRMGFCDWIKSLPYSELITEEDKNKTFWLGTSYKHLLYTQNEI